MVVGNSDKFKCNDEKSVSSTVSTTADIFISVKSLQCGDGLITILPSVIYLVGIALLVHHIITMNIRPQLYRRVGRELLLQVPWQEILILMLVYQCIRIWLSTLMIMNTMFKFYQKQLSSVHPSGIGFNHLVGFRLDSISGISKCCWDCIKIPFIVFYVSRIQYNMERVAYKNSLNWFEILTGLAPLNRWFEVTDLQNLHPIVLLFLVPKFMKICVCTALSFLPLMALFKLKERRPLPQFMLWMGPVRRDRSELGASGYYLERPFSEVSVNTSDCYFKRSNSCNNIDYVKIVKPKRLRARKSASV